MHFFCDLCLKCSLSTRFVQFSLLYLDGAFLAQMGNYYYYYGNVITLLLLCYTLHFLCNFLLFFIHSFCCSQTFRFLQLFWTFFFLVMEFHLHCRLFYNFTYFSLTSLLSALTWYFFYDLPPFLLLPSPILSYYLRTLWNYYYYYYLLFIFFLVP